MKKKFLLENTSVLIIAIMAAFIFKPQNVSATEKNYTTDSTKTFSIPILKNIENSNNYFNNKYLNTKELINCDNIVSINDNTLSFAKETLISATNKSLIQKEEIIRKDTLNLVMNSKESAERLANSLQGGSVYEEGWDSSITVKLYSTIYYGRRKGIQNATFTYIKSMDGGYTVSGSNGTTISSHYIRYSQTGMSEKTGTLVTQTKETAKYAASKKTWSITPPSTWVAVHTGTGGDIGCTYFMTLKRPNGYTYQAMLVNHVNGDV